MLFNAVSVPKGKTTRLTVEVNNHPKGDWLLAIRIDGEEVLKKIVEGYTWQPVEVNLTPYAGKAIQIEMENRLHGEWKFEAGYWSELKIVSEKSGH